MNRELITYNDPKSPVSEMFKTLRTNIQFMNSDKQLKTLLVSSTLPGEGKSWTAANLAVTFAQAGKKVLIIDGDMRKGRQFNIFGVSPTPGLSNYLSGVSEDNIDNSNINNYIQQTEVDNLFVMTAGNVPPNPSELLVSEKMIELSKIVRELFDITIFDGTPSLIVTDAPILARIVDSTIIVTAHNETKIDNVSKVKKAIESIGGKVAGVVVNKMPVSAKKYENSYYYGSYGSYGSTMPTVVKGKKNKHNKNHNSSFDETTETSIEKEIKENWNQIEEQTWKTTEQTADDWKNSSKEKESWSESSSTEPSESWNESSSTETSENWSENSNTETSESWSENSNTETSESWNESSSTEPTESWSESSSIESTESWNESSSTEPTESWSDSSSIESNESWSDSSSTESTESWSENNSTSTESWSENNSTEWEENEKIIDTTNLNKSSSEEWKNEQWNENVSEPTLDWSNTTQEEPVAAEPILSWEQDSSFSSEPQNTNYNSGEVFESTQNVINQINKYLEGEKNKLKNGDLND